MKTQGISINIEFSDEETHKCAEEYSKTKKHLESTLRDLNKAHIEIERLISLERKNRKQRELYEKQLTKLLRYLDCVNVILESTKFTVNITSIHKDIVKVIDDIHQMRNDIKETLEKGELPK